MKIITIEVTGRIPFPLDMLRYDQCAPNGGHDAEEIGRSLARERDEDGKSVSRTVRLNCYRRSGPTSDRWSSFGWTMNIVG
jgi:hypothetical protein